VENQHWAIPEKIAIALQNIQKAVDALVEVAGHKQKRFTLDGRIIGDIGEILAAYYFDISLTENQKKGFDAVINSGANKGENVEIKCRKNSTIMAFRSIPPFLIVIEISKTEDTFELVYAGPGSILNDLKPNFLLSDDPYKVIFDIAHFRKHFNYQVFKQYPSIPLRAELPVL